MVKSGSKKREREWRGRMKKGGKINAKDRQINPEKKYKKIQKGK